MRCKTIYWLAIIMCFLAVGCENLDDGSYVKPITINEKINGDWGLTNLKMVDELAKANAIEPHEESLNTFFNYGDFKIRFSVDDQNNPTTYEVMGNVPELFAPKGYWRLSSDFQQTDASAVKILLYSDAQKTQKTDELRLTSVPGSSDEMEFQLVHSSGGSPFVTYVFKFKAIK